MDTYDASAELREPSWDDLGALGSVLDAPPQPAATPGSDVFQLSDLVLPSWSTLDQLARVLRFQLEPTREAPCPIDLDRLYVVRYLNQTANKPLHLGHLRNAVLGAASANCAQALGARVVRQCVIEDTGRFMTEAMAALAAREKTHDAITPESGEKSDVFIGRCYVAYREAITANTPGGPTATTGYEVRNDEADVLQRELTRHEENATRLWSLVRNLTLGGQEQTLRDLGLAFDCCEYESSEDAHLPTFIELGLKRGVFVLDDSGQVVFPRPSGHPLCLVNPAGLYEESARLLSLIWRLLTGSAGEAIHVVIAGAEWRSSMRSYPGIMAGLGLEEHRDRYAQAFYGMVTRNGRKMSSSDGSGVLVDVFLADLAGDSAVNDVVRSAVGRAEPIHVVASILKCFLLGAPRVDAIEFDIDLLRDPAVNPGWSLVRAWTQLERPRSRLGPTPSEPCRRLLEDALTRVSFEAAVSEAAFLAGEILTGRGQGQVVEDFEVLMQALTLVPAGSRFEFTSAPTLVGLEPTHPLLG